MLRPVKGIFGIVIVILIAALPFFYGCKGSDTREKVDNTVEELAGKKQVDQMKKMEKDIGEITDKQDKKFNDFDETESEGDE